MWKKEILLKILSVTLIIGLIVGIVLLVVTFATAKKTSISLPPNPPANQKTFVVQLKSNRKWQVVLTTFTGTSPTIAFDKPYYILYNPQISSDPTQTTFNDKDSATSFVYTQYTTSPVNKTISAISMNTTQMDYSNFQECA